MSLSDIYAPILPRVAPFLRGCEVNVQKQAIRDAGRVFLDESEIWEESVFKYTVAGQAEYNLLSNYHQADTDSDFEIDAGEMVAYQAAFDDTTDADTPPNPVLTAWVDNAQAIVDAGGLYDYDGSFSEPPNQWVSVAALAEYDVFIKRVKALYVDGSNRPESQNRWSLSPTGILKFDSAPTVSDKEIRAQVVYIPNINAEVYQNWILQRFWSPIAAFALHTLYSMPRRPWSDPSAAEKKLIEYSKGLLQAQYETDSLRQNSSVQFHSIPFA